MKRLIPFAKKLARGGVSIDEVYPVGSIYLSVSSMSPQTLFGGTWEQIQDRFIMASGSNYSALSTGGSNDAVVVSHSHSASAASGGNHTHSGSANSNGSHTHSISGGSHNHTATSASAGSHTHKFSEYMWRAKVSSEANYDTNQWIVAHTDKTTSRISSATSEFDTASSGQHAHSINVNTSSSHSHTMTSAGSHTHSLDIDYDGAHTHSVTVTSAGEDGTGKNMPAYIAVNVWRRTA